MNKWLVTILPVLFPALLAGQVINPVEFSIECGLIGRYYFPSGIVSVGQDPQDVLVLSLEANLKDKKPLPAGSYDLYLCVASDQGKGDPRLIELAMGDSVQPVGYSPVAGVTWIGPIRFTSSYPVDVLHMRNAKSPSVYIDKYYILSAGSPVPKDITPLVANAPAADWRTVWIDLPDVHKAPAWTTPDMPVQVRVRAAAVGRPFNAPIECHILDYDHKEVGTYKFTVAVSGGKSFQKLETIPVPVRYGPYLLRFLVSLPDGEKAEYQRIVARVAPPLEFVTDRWGGHGNGPLLRRMGAGWNRLHDAGGRAVGYWDCVEPEKGKFIWRDDLIMPGIKNLGVIENGPEWAKQGYDSPEWLPYIRQTVSHYKGKVPAWEIFNEPYLTPTEEFAKKHVARVTAAAKAIRESDPAAVVTSGGPPEEIPPGLGWWEVLLKHGLAKPLDTISVHGYFGGGGTCPVDADLRFDAYMTALRKLCDQYGGKGKPLWDTESGLCPMESFYIGRNVTYGIYGSSGMMPRGPVPYRDAAAMDARYLMLHFWHNIRWNYYHTIGCWSNAWALCDVDWTPLPAAVTMAQITRLLADAQADGRLKLPEGLWGLQFKKGPDTVAAFWATFLKLGESRFLKNFKTGPNIRPLDMFLNPITPTAKFPIGAAPILLVGPEKEIQSALAQLAVVSEIDPNAGPRKANQCLTDPKRNPPAKVTADSTAPDYRLDPVRDTITVGAGTPSDAWVSKSQGAEHWLEYEWPGQVTINRLISAWPPDAIPARLRIEWFDGLNWHPCSGTPDWRTPVLVVEDYTINRVQTQKLRMRIVPKAGQPAKVTEFAAFYHPRLTPPVSEMQEIWTRPFAPTPQGYIKDWLVCGPFPSPGTRYNKSEKPTNWDVDFLDVCWIYGKGMGEPVIQPKVEQEHHAFFPPGTRAPWKPMDVVVAWQPVHAANDGKLDLARAMQNDVLMEKVNVIEQCFGYAATYIDLPDNLEGFMAIGSDDGYKSWIDDKVVAENIVFRQALPDQEKHPVKLAKGKHRILVKLHNDLGGHELLLRFLDPAGKPVTNYTVRLTP